MFDQINLNLENKYFLVTGAAGSIGKMISEYLANYGANLILIDKDIKKLKELNSKLKVYKKSVKYYQCNFERENNRNNVLNKILKENKLIDTIINNAAYIGDTKLKNWDKEFKYQSVKNWKNCFEVNLTSIFHICQKLTKLLNKSKSPSIINISSIYGIMAPDFDIYKNENFNNPAAYSVSKSGLIYLTRWLASSLAPKIRVNCISIGGIKRNQSKTFKKKYIDTTLLKRMATEEDIIGSILFLSTSFSNYITGQNIIIDGGKSIK